MRRIRVSMLISTRRGPRRLLQALSSWEIALSELIDFLVSVFLRSERLDMVYPFCITHGVLWYSDKSRLDSS